MAARAASLNMPFLSAPKLFPPAARLRGPLLGCVLLAAALPLPAQNPPLTAAPPDTVETGVPAFVVLGTAALGLSAAPTDLHQMDDGRLLVVTRNEFALGDGVRWEVFRQSEGVNGWIP